MNSMISIFGKVPSSTAFSHSKGKRSVSFNLSGKLKVRICWPVLFLCFLGIGLLNRMPSFGQAGSLDESFNPGSGANGEITIMAMQPDGKIVIAGSFTSYNGIPAPLGIARLNPDGTHDPSFVLSGFPSSGGTIHGIVIQADGKIVIGGNFSAGSIFTGLHSKPTGS